MRADAKLLGEEAAVELLDQTLNEEKETDQKLTQLAEKINVEAELIKATVVVHRGSPKRHELDRKVEFLH